MSDALAASESPLPSSTPTSAFDRARLFRARLAATRSFSASSAVDSTINTAVPTLPAPAPPTAEKSEAPYSSPTAAASTSEGQIKKSPPLRPKSVPSEARGTAAFLPSRPAATTSPVSPPAALPSTFSASSSPAAPLADTAALVAAVASAPPAPQPHISAPAFSPYPIPPAGAISTFGLTTPASVPVSPPLTFVPYDPASAYGHVAASTSGWAPYAGAPVPSSTSYSPPLVTQTLSPQPASSAPPRQSQAVPIVAPSAAPPHGNATAPSALPLASASASPTSPPPSATSILHLLESDSAAVTESVAAHPLPPKSAASPHPPPARPFSSSSSPGASSLAAFERTHGPTRFQARDFATRTLGILDEIVASLEEIGRGGGVDAAVALRWGEKAEEELIRVGKEFLSRPPPPPADPARDKTRYDAPHSLLYLLLTLPSLPSLSSLTSAITSVDAPNPLAELIVELLLRLPLVSNSEGDERASEAKMRVEGAVAAWTAQVGRLKAAYEQAKRDGPTLGDELRDARARISKLDGKLGGVQGELKSAQEAVKEWRERAVKAEARLEDKPSRRVALLLENVETLTHQRDAFETELSTLRTSHDAVKAELDSLRGSGSVAFPDRDATAQVDVLRARNEQLSVALQRARDLADADQLTYDERVSSLREELEAAQKKAEEARKRADESERKRKEERSDAEMERKGAGRREREAREEVEKLRAEEKRLRQKLEEGAPGGYPPSPDKSRTAAPASADAASGSSADVDALRAQLRQKEAALTQNKFVVDRLAKQLKGLNREISQKTEENADLMMRLAQSDQ
ncbi:hypothetical protein JCM10207_004392 [Rhodosporidiobolus poonsookiae]